MGIWALPPAPITIRFLFRVLRISHAQTTYFNYTDEAHIYVFRNLENIVTNFVANRHNTNFSNHVASVFKGESIFVVRRDKWSVRNCNLKTENSETPYYWTVSMMRNNITNRKKSKKKKIVNTWTGFVASNDEPWKFNLSDIWLNKFQKWKDFRDHPTSPFKWNHGYCCSSDSETVRF